MGKKSKMRVDDVAEALAAVGLEMDVAVASRWEPPSDTLIITGNGYNDQFYVRETFDEVLDRLETLGSADAAILLNVVGRDGGRMLLRTSAVVAVIDMAREETS